MDLSDNNQWLPSTPAKSTHSSSICDKSLISSTPSGEDNDIAEKRAGFADSMPDQESTTTNNLAPLCQSHNLNDESAEFSPSFGISTPGKSIPLRPNSHHVYAESSIFTPPPPEGDHETVIQKAERSDQESTTTRIETGSPPQCCDLDDKVAEHLPRFDPNAKLTESLPVNSTPASKDRKRKVGGQDYVGTPKEKKKKYWPKVIGQTKRKTTPKVSNESKTKGGHVSMANGDKEKYKRTPKSKSEKIPLLSKRKSCKRSLIFEQEEDIEEPLHMPDGLNELTVKGDSLQMPTEKIPEERVNLRCLLLNDVWEEETNISMRRRSKILKKKSIQERKLPFQLIIKRKRSNKHKRKANFDSLVFCNPTSLSRQRVEDEKKESQELIYEIQWKTKGKRRKRMKKITKRKRMKKAEPANFKIDTISKQDFGTWGTREGSKSPYSMGNFVEYPFNEDDKGENGAKDHRKGKTRRETKTTEKMVLSNEMVSNGIGRSEVEVIIEKFQSLNITIEAPYKNQDRRLVPFKGNNKGRRIEVNGNNTELVSYENQHRVLVPYKGKKEGQRIKVKVNLDAETLKEWNIIMHGKSRDENEDNSEYWKQERSTYLGRVNAFIARMHNFLGNRSFSPWKGSVVDSVVGVFLTQNVSDHLSSSAYMSLASTFPINTSSGERKDNMPLLKLEDSSKSSTTNDSLNLGNKKFYSPGIVFGKKKLFSTRKKGDQIEQERKMKEEQEDEEQDKQHWESLRRMYMPYCTPRSSDHADSVDWEAVRCADVDKVAKAIEARGQHNIIARRIQALLNKLVEMHGSIDLEWLRYAPPSEAKEYLLKVYGLGLKSVECIRLLALEQIAFPVDVNVGRIAVRLGWVPLEPLPGSIQFHLLDQYPIMDMVQQYLWPRLYNIDQPTLYQLHYHLITFGKVFCTKKNPNCKACPMRGECKHFASASASPTFALPENDVGENNSSVRSDVLAKPLKGPSNPLIISYVNDTSTTDTPQCEPIVDYPVSPSQENIQFEMDDIEDYGKSDGDSVELTTLNLDDERFKAFDDYFKQDDMESSNVVVTYNPYRASKFMPQMKSVSRLRTERMVYVLPDKHPLLTEFPRREADDPSNYLLVMWAPGELKEEQCNATQNQGCCSNSSCFSCNNINEEGNQTVLGTILIPCRTATDGRFPLNGTYFQVNEVFADAESSQRPIRVPTKWLWNLPTRIAYFGTSTSTIIRGLPLEEIQVCFWRGYVCVRAVDLKTGAPRPLPFRFHCKTTDQIILKKKRQSNDQDLKGNQSELGPTMKD